MAGSLFPIAHGIKRYPTNTSAVTWCGARLRLPSKQQSKQCGWPVTCARCKAAVQKALRRIQAGDPDVERLLAYEYPTDPSCS